jgi:hypothetical protein
MNRILIALITLVGTSIAIAPVARAQSADLRLGTFGREWCGYAAAFNIESKEPDRWVFHGHVSFAHFPDVDELWIEQYEDDSLRMIRYLSGSQTGMVQTVQTHPPKFLKNSVNFEKVTSYGPDCEGAAKGAELALPDG